MGKYVNNQSRKKRDGSKSVLVWVPINQVMLSEVKVNGLIMQIPLLCLIRVSRVWLLEQVGAM